MKLSDVIVEPPETAPRTRVLVVCLSRAGAEYAKRALLRQIELGPRLRGVQTYSPAQGSVGVICLDGSHVIYDFRGSDECVVKERVETADFIVYAPHVRGMEHDYFLNERVPAAAFDVTPFFPAWQACITRRGW